MNLICPECKNSVDLMRYANIQKKMVIECNMCGITLEVLDVVDSNVSTQIIDESK